MLLSLITRAFGFAGMIGALAIVYLFETQSHATGWMRVLHWPAMVLTGLGPFALLFLCFDFVSVMRALFASFFGSPERLQKKKLREAVFLHKLGTDYAENGPSVFDSVKTKGLSPMVSTVVERLSLRMPTADIYELAQIQKDKREWVLSSSISVVATAVRLTPSIGMLGTIMGMVNLLANLSDPSKIGEHMSLALLTTFYGLFFSIALWTPLQQKMEKILNVEIDSYDQTLRWLDLMQRKKPTDYFADSTDLPKKKRKKAA